MSISTPFSSEFVANFKHVFASLVVVFICLSYCLRKELIDMNIYLEMYMLLEPDDFH